MSTETKTPAESDMLHIAGVLTGLTGAVLAPFEDNDYSHIVLPAGYKREDISDAIEKTRNTPNRKRGRVTLKSIESLATYCKDQDAADSDRASVFGYIYADPDTRSMVAVFNDQKFMPGWRDHRAEFKAEYTPEFAKWVGMNGKHLSQTEFAEFIEDNMADITEPAATSMLEMATTIQAKTGINFSSAKRLENGQVQLQYTEEIDARAGANGAMAIPKEFALGLRIFKNGEGYKLRARLKYRLNGGAIKFWFELDRPERAIEDAFAGYVDKMREFSGYTVLIGTP